MFNAVTTVETIRLKVNWAMRWINNMEQPYAVRLVAFAAVEGIFFSSSFAAIFWLRSRGLLPGLCHMNELIARDEGLHTNFACLLHQQLLYKPPQDVVENIIRQAVDIEVLFFRGRRFPEQRPHEN